MGEHHSAPPAGPRTIVVVHDSIVEPYQAAVCAGIAASARGAGETVFFVAGGPIPEDASTEGPHRIYDLISAGTAEGTILLSASLAYRIGERGFQSWAQRFQFLPTCSIGTSLTGSVSVTIDNRRGVDLLVEHLVVTHGARRIAFVTGPAENPESELRLCGYRDALRRHSLLMDDRLVAHGNFLADSAPGAVQTLSRVLTGGLRELDAIVAANDFMAIGIMSELRRLGVEVPGEIAVAGFDDTDEAQLVQPALTTVAQPMGRLGEVSLEQLRARLQGQPGEGDCAVPTVLAVRASCGCLMRWESTALDGPRMSAPDLPQLLLSKLIDVEEQLTALGAADLQELGSDWASALTAAFIEDLLTAKAERFVPSLSGLLQRLSRGERAHRVLGEALTLLRREVIPLVRHDIVRRCLAEDLLQTARLDTCSSLERCLGYTNLELVRWSRALAILSNKIARCTTRDALAGTLQDALARLGLRSAFVCTHEGASKARLVVAYAGTHEEHPTTESLTTAVAATRGAVVFDRAELLPRKCLGRALEGRQWVVLPLLIEQRVIGHAVFEYCGTRSFAFSVIAQALGIALRRLESPAPVAA